MSDLWREDPNSDSHNYVAQSNIGGWSRISSHPVVPLKPVGTLTVNDLNRVMVDDGESIRPLPAGKYLIVEADDE